MIPSFDKIVVPVAGQRITVLDGTLHVPDNPIIVAIKGDGIGRTIGGILGVTDCALQTLDAAVQKAYQGMRKIHWMEALAGDSARELYRPTLTDDAINALPPLEQQGVFLPPETVTALDYFTIGLKGPLNTPSATGFRSINVALRKMFDLYACVRPIKHFEGIPPANVHSHGLDMIIFRENTEDVYRGIEFKAGTEEQRKLQQFLIDELGADLDPTKEYNIGIKPMSQFGARRLIRRAIIHARDNHYSSVTMVTKSNIMKFTEGGFRDEGYALAREEFGDICITEKELWESYGGAIPAGKIAMKDRHPDAMLQEVQLRPLQYGVLAMPNLNGDLFSDGIAAQVGGIGVAPGANINYETRRAIFEATHGTAPRYAGKDMANPTSIILSGAMMLDYIGWHEAAQLVHNAVTQAMQEAGAVAASGERPIPLTFDLVEQFKGYTATDAIRCFEFMGRIRGYIQG